MPDFPDYRYIWKYRNTVIPGNTEILLFLEIPKYWHSWKYRNTDIPGKPEKQPGIPVYRGKNSFTVYTGMNGMKYWFTVFRNLGGMNPFDQ